MPIPLFGAKIEGVIAEQIGALLASEENSLHGQVPWSPDQQMTGLPGTDRRFIASTLSCPDRHRHRRADHHVPGGHRRLDHRGGLPLGRRIGRFFTRQVIRADSLAFDVAELRARFAEVAEQLAADSWQVTDTAGRQDGGPAGVQGGPLPVRTAGPLALRGHGRGHRRRHRQPHRPRAGGHAVRPAVPAHPGAG